MHQSTEGVFALFVVFHVVSVRHESNLCHSLLSFLSGCINTRKVLLRVLFVLFHVVSVRHESNLCHYIV